MESPAAKIYAQIHWDESKWVITVSAQNFSMIAFLRNIPIRGPNRANQFRNRSQENSSAGAAQY